MNQVIDQVELRDFIDQLGDGLNSKVGERGKLSGGQIQRIAIARAVIKNQKYHMMSQPTHLILIQKKKF